MPLWSALTAAYRQHNYLAGRQPLFLLVAFVLGFAFIRAVRPGCACRLRRRGRGAPPVPLSTAARLPVDRLIISAHSAGALSRRAAPRRYTGQPRPLRHPGRRSSPPRSGCGPAPGTAASRPATGVPAAPGRRCRRRTTAATPAGHQRQRPARPPPRPPARRRPAPGRRPGWPPGTATPLGRAPAPGPQRAPVPGRAPSPPSGAASRAPRWRVGAVPRRTPRPGRRRSARRTDRGARAPAGRPGRSAAHSRRLPPPGPPRPRPSTARAAPAPTTRPAPGSRSRPRRRAAAGPAALPDQPRHAAVVVTGIREPAGWWGPARPALWTDAVEAARVVATAVSAPLTVRAGQRAPWHPGRCAELIVGDRVVGFAGELHPRAIAALGLPLRTAAMELDLGPVLASAPEVVSAPVVSAFPVATQDVALVLDAAVPVAEVAAALDAGAGDLLESLRLFDVYTGDQVPPGHRSLAYSLRFRAPDRTLTVAETTAARDAAVAEAARSTGRRAAVESGTGGALRPRRRRRQAHPGRTARLKAKPSTKATSRNSGCRPADH